MAELVICASSRHVTLLVGWSQDQEDTKVFPHTWGLAPELDSVCLSSLGEKGNRGGGCTGLACQHALNNIKEHFTNALLDKAQIRPVREEKHGDITQLEPKGFTTLFENREGEKCINPSQWTSWTWLLLFRCSCQLKNFLRKIKYGSHQTTPSTYLPETSGPSWGTYTHCPRITSSRQANCVKKYSFC